MRLHPVKNFDIDRVVVFENATKVADGRLSDLIYTPGDDSCTDIFMHPDRIPAFRARYLPAEGRLN